MRKLVITYLAFSAAGLLAFAALLILKLISPDIPGLTWFWVFSPLWMAWAGESVAVGAWAAASCAKGGRDEGD